MYSYKYVYNSSKNRHEWTYVDSPSKPNYFSKNVNNNFYNNNNYNNNNYNRYEPYKSPLNLTGTSNYNSEGISNPDTDNIPKFGNKMKRFTYSLFAYNILLILIVIIYCSIVFDSNMLVNFIVFLVLFIASEVLYIFYSLKLFIKKTLDENKNCYGIIVIVCGTISFAGAMVDFTGGGLPVGHYAIFIGGMSVLFLMSIVYFILVLKIGQN